MRIFLSLACATSLLLTSCVDIFDEIILHNDGSGTYKYTINLSASKLKINSVLALDSVDGQRVPKLPEIKEKIAFYKDLLMTKEGITNVKVDANYTDFVFKFSCDFASVSNLQAAVREIILAESKDKENPIINETWLSWDGKQLVRSIPNFQSPINRLKSEDQETLKKGHYISVCRFDREILKSDNSLAIISPSKTAVMVKASIYNVSNNHDLIKNTVSLTPQ